MKPEPVANYIVTSHAALEMGRRGLSRETVDRVMAAPEQWVEARTGRIILQSRIFMEDAGRIYLIRVFVDVDRNPCEVVTVYRTSKVSKYWREEP